MTPELKQNIREELKAYLLREPTENEIINAQTDTNIMEKVHEKTRKKEMDALKKDVSDIKGEVDKLKTK